ncbi:hypothetical protein A2U01_0059616, partial [Trifolium medium]|nr:hypothetical protein [Trifolium medium]
MRGSLPAVALPEILFRRSSCTA